MVFEIKNMQIKQIANGMKKQYDLNMSKYRINQIVYIVQSCREIRQMKVIKYFSEFYTLRFLVQIGYTMFAHQEMKKSVSFLPGLES